MAVHCNLRCTVEMSTIIILSRWLSLCYDRHSIQNQWSSDLNHVCKYLLETTIQFYNSPLISSSTLNEERGPTLFYVKDTLIEVSVSRCVDWISDTTLWCITHTRTHAHTHMRFLIQCQLRTHVYMICATWNCMDFHVIYLLWSKLKKRETEKLIDRTYRDHIVAPHFGSIAPLCLTSDCNQILQRKRLLSQTSVVLLALGWFS